MSDAPESPAVPPESPAIPGAAAFADADVRERFRLDAKGRPVASVDNAVLILTADPRWAGVIAYDQFAGAIVKRRKPPIPNGTGEWEDIDDAELRLWFCGQFGFEKLTKDDLYDAISIAARRASFHDVRGYLLGLTWDERPRVRHWLTAYLGAAETPYTQRAGEIWLVSAVARVLNPDPTKGIKVDHVLILEGAQELGKSTALKALGGQFFTDAPFRLDNPTEAAMVIRGKWIIELAELDGLSRADTSAAKRFFSQTEDRYRPPYGRRVSTVPRQCVFSGTVNHLGDYLRDETGNRRYLPVHCTRADIAELEQDRDRIWAEAVALYRAGVTWWPSAAERPIFGLEQEARYQVDAWEQLIASYLAFNPDVLRFFGAGDNEQGITTREILDKALKLDVAKWTRAEQTRIGNIMQRLGWPKKRAASGLREYYYQRPEDWPPRSVLPTSRSDEQVGRPETRNQKRSV